MDIMIEGMWDWVWEFWNGSMTAIQTLLTASPWDFGSGGAWNAVSTLFSAVQGVAYSLTVIFFYIGLARSTLTLMELRRPAVAFTLIVRFLAVYLVIGGGMGFLQMFIGVGQSLIQSMFSAGGGMGEMAKLPDEIRAAIEAAPFWDKSMLFTLTLLSVAVIVVMGLTILITVYGRFFKIYIAVALAPIPLATFAGEPTQNIGIGYLRTLAGICMEGVVAAVACVVYAAIVSSVPAISIAGDALIAKLLNYIVTVVLQTLLLSGMIKGADYLARQFLGG